MMLTANNTILLLPDVHRYHIFCQLLRPVKSLYFVCIVIHTNQSGIKNTQESHTNKECIYNMYINYIPELDFSSLFFSAIILLQFLFQRTLSLQKKHSTSMMPLVSPAQRPRRVSHALSPSVVTLRLRCFIHYHHMISVLPDSIIYLSFNVINNFTHTIFIPS